MNLLLDSYIVLWWLSDDERLTRKARRLVERANEVFVSAATTWELAVIISKRGKPLLQLVPIEGQKGQRPVELYPHKLSNAEMEKSLKPLSEEELAEWHRHCGRLGSPHSKLAPPGINTHKTVLLRASIPGAAGTPSAGRPGPSLATTPWPTG